MYKLSRYPRQSASAKWNHAGRVTIDLGNQAVEDFLQGHKTVGLCHLVDRRSSCQIEVIFHR